MGKPDNILGYGQVRNKKGKWSYSGIFPPDIKDNDLVFMIKSRDLQTILESEQTMLMNHRYDMEEQFYNPRRATEIAEGLYGVFPAEITFTAPKELGEKYEGRDFKLFLDKHWYSRNPVTGLWMRFISVDQAWLEEDMGDPNRKIEVDGEEDE